MVGNYIYKHVEEMVGEETCPKVTGMMIFGLPLAELNFSVSSYETLQAYVNTAVQKLIDTGYL